MANTRPAAPLPDWATDANYSSGPDSGIATKLQPLSGEVAGGYFRTGRVPARKLNWQLNKIGTWINWGSLHWLDGENGGNYAPDSRIIIGGAGLTVVGPGGLTPDFEVTGSVLFGFGFFGVNSQTTFSNTVDFSDTITVDGLSTFSGNVNFNGSGTVVGVQASVAAWSFLCPVIIDCASTPVEILHDLAVVGTSQLGKVTLIDELVLQAPGRIRDKSIYVPNADTHVDVTQGNVVISKSGVVSAGRILTIDNTGASDGSRIEFHNYTTFAQTVHNFGGATLGTVPAVSGAIPGVAEARFEDDGSGARWLVIG